MQHLCLLFDSTSCSSIWLGAGASSSQVLVSPALATLEVQASCELLVAHNMALCWSIRGAQIYVSPTLVKTVSLAGKRKRDASLAPVRCLSRKFTNIWNYCLKNYFEGNEPNLLTGKRKQFFFCKVSKLYVQTMYACQHMLVNACNIPNWFHLNSVRLSCVLWWKEWYSWLQISCHCMILPQYRLLRWQE